MVPIDQEVGPVIGTCGQYTLKYLELPKFRTPLINFRVDFLAGTFKKSENSPSHEMRYIRQFDQNYFIMDKLILVERNACTILNGNLS
jgi:hypothetical protein